MGSYGGRGEQHTDVIGKNGKITCGGVREGNREQEVGKSVNNIKGYFSKQ